MAERNDREHGFAVTAFGLVQEATNEAEPGAEADRPESTEGKNPHAVALGRLGGLKGGKARLQKLTPEQRTEIARRAAEARWNKARRG